jgi:hypothetical protein
MTADRWIRASEAGRRLGVCDETIYRLCRRGRLTYRRDEDTGTWRIDAQSVALYDRARTVTTLRVPRELEAVATRFATPAARRAERGR